MLSAIKYNVYYIFIALALIYFTQITAKAAGICSSTLKYLDQESHPTKIQEQLSIQTVHSHPEFSLEICGSKASCGNIKTIESQSTDSSIRAHSFLKVP